MGSSGESTAEALSADLPERASLAVTLSRLMREPPEPVYVGRYALHECIGAGAYGTVHRAHDPKLDRDVAIKLVSTRRPGRMAPGRLAERLAREARAMAALSHPNIVPVYDVGRTRDGLFITMELLRGCTLRRWVDARRAEAPEDWRSILAMFVQAGRGLAAAHGRGLIQRDFKPDNVMVTEAGVAKVLDFGLVRAREGTASAAVPWSRASASAGDTGSGTDDDSAASASSLLLHEADLTATGLVMGTPRYMAPEQHAGGPLDAPADQFAFCVALFEALYGVAPFAGRDLRTIARAKREGRIVVPPAGSKVDARVLAAIRRGLAPDPSDRHATMGELLAALERGARRSRRAPAIALGGLVLAGGIAWMFVDHDEGCAPAREHIAERWSDAERERLGRAFAASGVDGADDAWTRVQPALDDYFSAWAPRWDDACAAASVPARSRRVTCLRRSLAAVDATLDLFAEADADVVHHARSMAARATALDACRDGGDDDERTSDDRVAPAVRDAVQARIARALALHDAGKVQAASELAEGVLADVRDLGDPRLEAAAQAAVGMTAAATSRAQRAREAYARAYFLQSETDQRAEAFGTALRLVGLLAGALAEPDETQRWLRHADAAVAPDARTPAQRASFLEARAAVAGARADADAAIADMRRAVEILAGLDAYDTARARHDLANNLTTAGRLEEAKVELEAALAQWHATLGPRHPNVALTTDALGSVEAQLGHHEAAVALHEAAFELAEEVFGPDALATANIRTNLGIAQTYARHFGPAQRHLRRAVELYAARVGEAHPSYGRARMNLGIAYAHAGRPHEARVEHEAAYRILEPALGPDHPLVAVCRLDLADVLLATGHARRALVEADAAVAVIGRAYADTPYAAAAYTTQGHALLANDRPHEAIVALTEALRLYDKGASVPEHVAEAQFGLARALRATGGDPDRIQTLARDARAQYAARTPGAQVLAEIDAFLAAPL